jgi:predicted dienelactone hydrolase
MLPACVVATIVIAAQLANDLRGTDFNRKLSRPTAIVRISFIVIGIATVSLAGLLSLALPVFDMPEPSGPYPVGTTAQHFVDYNRPDNCSSHSGAHRQIPVRIWYPAEKSRLTNLPYLEPAEAEALALTYDLPSFFFNHLPLIETHSTPRSPVAEGMFPLVLYSPSGYVSQATAMCEDLASHGYVVAAINHAYWNAYAQDSDGTIIALDRNNACYREMWQEELSEKTERLKDQITRAEDYDHMRQLHRKLNLAMPAEVKDIREWALDVSFVIDRFAQGLNGAIQLRNVLDLERIGVIGFSKGGAAAGQSAIHDRRIGAGINLDGFMFGDVVDTDIPCPFMFVHSEPFLPKAYINDGFFESALDDAVLAKIRGTRHANFSDLSLFGPLITSSEHFGPIPGRRLMKLQNMLVRTFYDGQLKGSGIDESLIHLDSIPEIELRSKAR